MFINKVNKRRIVLLILLAFFTTIFASTPVKAESVDIKFDEVEFSYRIVTHDKYEYTGIYQSDTNELTSTYVGNLSYSADYVDYPPTILYNVQKDKSNISISASGGGSRKSSLPSNWEYGVSTTNYENYRLLNLYSIHNNNYYLGKPPEFRYKIYLDLIKDGYTNDLNDYIISTGDYGLFASGFYNDASTEWWNLNEDVNSQGGYTHGVLKYDGSNYVGSGIISHSISSPFSDNLATGNRVSSVEITYKITAKPSNGKATPTETKVTAPETKPVTAIPTKSKVYVDGLGKSFEAYTINGNNYFKLRDIAMVLNGTNKQFEVGFNKEKNAIFMTSKTPYTPVGGEMTLSGVTENRQGIPTASKLYIDGKEISLTAYSIGGNNYFKLRDIGEAFDFGVNWDNNTKAISILTSSGYSVDGNTKTEGKPIVNHYWENYESFDNALIVFSRTGSTNADLTVYYSVSGTAAMGVDYISPLSGSIVIPAGSKEAQVPFGWTHIERPEPRNILITLTPNNTYDISARPVIKGTVQ